MFKTYDKLFAGGFLLVLTVFIFSQIPKIRFIDVAGGARFFPVIVVILMLIVSVFLIIFGLMEFKKSRRMPASTFDKKAVVQIIFSLMMLAVFGLLMPLTGVIVSGVVYLAGSFFILAPKKKWNIPVFLLLSVSVPVVVYFVFTTGFKIMLPSGTLWR
jgi:quinol-cytochrome oxidoreductase complex cytochrome b subunit